jgi:hypothetical protein
MRWSISICLFLISITSFAQFGVGIDYSSNSTKFKYEGRFIEDDFINSFQVSTYAKYMIGIMEFEAGFIYAHWNYNYTIGHSCSDARVSYGYYYCYGKGVANGTIDQYGISIGMKENIILKWRLGIEQKVSFLSNKPALEQDVYTTFHHRTEHHEDGDSTWQVVGQSKDIFRPFDRMSGQLYVGLFKTIDIGNHELSLRFGRLFIPSSTLANSRSVTWQFGVSYNFVFKGEDMPIEE